MNLNRFLRIALLAPLVALLLVVSVALAQTETGRITGVIKDAKGDGISGVNIQVRSVDSGGMRKTVTSKNGSYTVANLRAGTYDVTVISSGREVMSKRTRVTIGSSARVDMTVTIEEAGQTGGTE